MAWFTLSGNELLDSEGRKVATVSGAEILDDKGIKVASMTAKEVLGPDGGLLASWHGNDVRDSSGKTIEKMYSIQGPIRGGRRGTTLVALWYLFVRPTEKPPVKEEPDSTFSRIVITFVLGVISTLYVMKEGNTRQGWWFFACAVICMVSLSISCLRLSASARKASREPGDKDA